MNASHHRRLLALTQSREQFETLANHPGVAVLAPLVHVPGGVISISSGNVQRLQQAFPGLQLIDDSSIQLLDPVEVASTIPAPSERVVPWGIRSVRADQVWQRTTGRGVKVCIIDTGIQRTHPDLTANISGGRNFVASAEGKIDPDAWEDDNGHGTHVAGTIAAHSANAGVVGVAPDAQLHIVKVLDSRGSGQLSSVIDGVHECVSAGAHVINMSLGSPGNPNENSPLHDAILHARAKGVTVVAAAGNSGASIKNYVPAGFSEVIAVSAMDEKMQFPSWNNLGLRPTDFAAPGVKVLSTFLHSGYAEMSGTSMAAPHVSGVAALGLSLKIHSLQARDVGHESAHQGAGLIDSALTIGAEAKLTKATNSRAPWFGGNLPQDQVNP